MKDRIQRVDQLIRVELARIILKEIEFPENILVTLSRVETTKDLKESKVFISVMPSEKIKEVIRTLNKKIYFLQKELDKKLKMRIIPKIIFFEERKIAEAGRIEEILADLKKEKR